MLSKGGETEEILIKDIVVNGVEMKCFTKEDLTAVFQEAARCQ